MSTGSVILSNHLFLCHPLLFLPSIFPSIRVFSNESDLCIRRPKYWTLSVSVCPVNIQDWSPLGLTGLTSLQSKGLVSVFSITTIRKDQFFSAVFFVVRLTCMHDYWCHDLSQTISNVLYQLWLSWYKGFPEALLTACIDFDWFWCLYSWPFRAFSGPVLLCLGNRSLSSAPCWYLKSWLLSTALQRVWYFSNKYSAGRTKAVFAFELS